MNPTYCKRIQPCSAKIVFSIFFCTILICHVLPLKFLYAKKYPVKFEHITVDEGLSQNTVLRIFQDNDGFLWFGTRDGLNRYDGHSLQWFKNDLLNAKSSYDNYFWFLYEDKAGTFWVGTAGELYTFDQYTGSFTSFGLKLINGIEEDNSGCLWVLTLNNGLFYYNDGNKKFTEYSFPLLIEGYNCLHKDSDGFLWIGTSIHGLVQFNPKTKKYRLFYPDTSGNPSLKCNHITSICEVPNSTNGVFWIATLGGGFFKFERETGSFTNFKHDPSNPNSLVNNHIRTMFYDNNDDVLWIGTENHGLNKYDCENNRFTHYRHNPSDPFSLSADDVYSIYKDRSGALWVGTKRGGVNKFYDNKIKFEHYVHPLDGANSAKDNAIWSIYEDRLGTVWVGAESGVFQLKKETVNSNDKLERFSKNETSSTYSIFSAPVRAFLEDHLGFFWIGFLGNGMVQFDRKNGKFIHFKNDVIDYGELFINNIYTLYEDLDKNFWLGLNNGGLVRFNRDKKGSEQFSQYLFRPIEKGMIHDWVFTIYESNRWLKENLWLGTWQKGLLLFNKKTEKFTYFQHDPADKSSLSNNTIFSIYEDRSGDLWIGTYGGGLNRVIFPNSNQASNEIFEKNKITFEHFTEKDGLCNNVIYGILEDDYGNLWLSTNNGLSKFHIETKNFTNYTVDDGLPGNEFNLGAFCKLTTGELCFGGYKGFVRFSPQKSVNNVPPTIAITAFKKFGTMVDFQKPILDVEHIKLSHYEDDFSLEFTALHFVEPQKNRCAFKLDGYDSEWNFTGAKGEAKYKNVSPGSYKFLVKACNYDGIWGEEQVSIFITIHPPFWKSWWFILLNCSLLLILIFGIHRFRMQQVVKYERAKAEEQELLRARIVANFHDELGHRITKISLMSKILLQQKEAIKTSDANFHTYLKQIADNADSLFKDMRECIWELDPKKDSIYDLAVYLKDFSDQLFEQTEIAFQLVIKSDKLEKIKLPVEWRRQLLRIFKEGMTNIIKHAHDCKNVRLEFILEDSTFCIVLSNDGTGFDLKNNIPGNGLQNMKDRAEKINGKLQIISDRLSGTKIILTGKLS